MYIDPAASVAPAMAPTAQTLHDAFVAGTMTEADYDYALGEVRFVPAPLQSVERL